MRHQVRAECLIALAAVVVCGACHTTDASPGDDAGSNELANQDAGALPPWLTSVKVLAAGPIDTTLDCRTTLCRHSEDTDLITWNGATWLVYRTANSQVLGPNSSLLVFRSTDEGVTFAQTARIPAPIDRDIRDPHFYVVGNQLHLKALTRLPVPLGQGDASAATISMGMHSADGVTWSALAPMGPVTQSFWRIKEHGGTYFSAAYDDSDATVTLFTSKDGETWAPGPIVYAKAEDTPGETELVFMPSGALLALVRMDGLPAELLGDSGRLRTKVCWAQPPAYDAFTCPQDLDGQRLDGPVAFFVGARVFVVARKHLQGTGRKRTSLFELGGTLDGGPLTVKEWGELPSAGDTAYAGVAMKADGRAFVTWYSGELARDDTWLFGMIAPTQIWEGIVDFSKLP